MNMSIATHSKASEIVNPIYWPKHVAYSLERLGPWWVVALRCNGQRHLKLHSPCEDHIALSPVSKRGYIHIAVADGVGSGARGDVCSEAAAHHAVDMRVNPIEETSSEIGYEQVRQCIESAETAVQSALRPYSDQPGASMLVAAWLDEQGKGHIAHVGDARAYLCSADDAQLLTKDHSYRNTSEVSAPGVCIDDPARMVGIYTGEPDIQKVALKSGEALLLCSDGMYGYMPEPDFLSLLVHQIREFGTEPDDAVAQVVAHQLLQATLAAGSDDDIAFTLAIYWPRSSQISIEPCAENK